MALRSPSSTPQPDLGPRDSPPAGTPPPTSQGGSSNGAKADVGKKTKEVDHLLAKLEKEGVVIDGKIASIVDDGIARIKAEAARENIKEPKRNGMPVLLEIAAVAVCFIMGAEWYDHAFRAINAKGRRAVDKELGKSRRA